MIGYAAPGRINLIGEHTDYNLGFALPIALPQRTVVRFTPRDSDAIKVCSDRFADSVDIPLDAAPGDVTGWAAYVAGVVWALRRRGHLTPGGDMSITSDLPMGAGLGSSAALESAVLGALLRATGNDLERIDKARIAQTAENDYLGTPTGLLDQLASFFAKPLHATLIDFHNLAMRSVPFDPDRLGLALLLIDSQVPHSHSSGEYAARRASCLRAAADLSVSALREVQHRGTPVLGSVRDAGDARRARHVLTENQRVLDFIAALDKCDYQEAGLLLNASHESMRDDFEITTERIDVIADAAVRAGAFGARMTGGGFGGSVIALASIEDIARIAVAVQHAGGGADLPAPTVTRARPGPGAAALPSG